MISNERVKHVFSGNGTSTTFQIPFDFFKNTAGVFDKNIQISVILRSTTGTETVLTEDTDYEVTTYDPSDSGSNGYSGYVHVFTAPAVGEKLVIMRDVPFVQQLHLEEGREIGRVELEAALDKVVMTLQQLNEKLGRAICYKPSTTSGQIDADAYIANLQALFTEGAQTVKAAAADAVSACEGYASTCQTKAQAAIEAFNATVQRMTTALTAANNAESSANAAERARDLALEYKGAAQTASSNAGTSETNAGIYKDAAASSATSAQNILDEIRNRTPKNFEFVAGTADATTGYTGSLTDFETGITGLANMSLDVHIAGVHKTRTNPSQYSVSGSKVIFPSGAVTSGQSVSIYVNGNLPNGDIPEASTTTKGIVQLATDAEITAGTNTSKAITPKQLSNVASAKQDALPSGTTGHYLKKTANGVEWAAVAAASGLTGVVVANSSGISKAASTGHFRTNIGTTEDIKFITLELGNASGTLWKLATYSSAAWSDRSGNFVTIWHDIDTRDFTETTLLDGDTYCRKITVWY